MQPNLLHELHTLVLRRRWEKWVARQPVPKTRRAQVRRLRQLQHLQWKLLVQRPLWIETHNYPREWET